MHHRQNQRRSNLDVVRTAGQLSHRPGRCYLAMFLDSDTDVNDRIRSNILAFRFRAAVEQERDV